MSRQTRNIYQSGNAELDRILADIANRLDVIEGLRPDLDAGYIAVDADKQIDTGDPVTGYQTVVNGVSIEDYSIILSRTASAGAIEVKDADGTVIHKME